MKSILLILVLLLTAISARAGDANIELGTALGHSLGANGIGSGGMLGFQGTVYFHKAQWLFGITTRGMFTTKANTNITTNQQNLDGSMAQRWIDYGFTVRRYYYRNYIQFSGSFASIEFLGSDRHLTFQQTRFDDRFFIDGYSARVGVGHEFEHGPFFIRAEYAFSAFNSASVIGTRAGINRAESDQDIGQKPHVHSFLLVFGIARLFDL